MTAPTKFTSGPWKATRSDPSQGADVWWITGIFSERGNSEKDIATVCGGLAPSAEANAQLIAAAPDLHRALSAAQAALKSYEYGNASPELAAEIGAFADRALAKAEGRS